MGSSDEAEEVGEVASAWSLERPKELKTELYVFSNLESSFEYIPPKSSRNAESIRMSTVLSPKRRKSTSEVRNENVNTDAKGKNVRRRQTDANLSESAKQRNAKYGNALAHHLKHTVLKTIAERVIVKDVGNLLTVLDDDIDSVRDIEAAKEGIARQYRQYLANVKSQMAQFVQVHV